MSTNRKHIGGSEQFSQLVIVNFINKINFYDAIKINL